MVRARKRFGQNFLVDQGIIGRIIRSIDIRPEDQLVEIGPGTGALTGHLSKLSQNLTLIEIDRDLAATLREQYPDVQLVNEDVMKLDLETLYSGTRLRVIGNLPYNISTPLLFRLFTARHLIRDMHFMLQLEVVDRMTAEPSTGSYGRLSVMTQLHCHAEKLFEVPREAFSPRPKVTSAIVRLTPVDLPDALDLPLLEQILIAAFSARRKTIRNGLRAFLSADQLESIGLDPGTRPETLSIDDFVRCTKAAGAGM